MNCSFVNLSDEVSSKYCLVAVNSMNALHMKLFTIKKTRIKKMASNPTLLYWYFMLQEFLSRKEKKIDFYTLPWIAWAYLDVLCHTNSNVWQQPMVNDLSGGDNSSNHSKPVSRFASHSS